MLNDLRVWHVRPESSGQNSGLAFQTSVCASPVSFRVTALLFATFSVTAVTVARNGYTCGSHALYVCQGCQAACLMCIGPIEWRLVYSSAVDFTHLSLRPSTVPTASVASFDYDSWT